MKSFNLMDEKDDIKKERWSKKKNNELKKELENFCNK